MSVDDWRRSMGILAISNDVAGDPRDLIIHPTRFAIGHDGLVSEVD